VQSLPPKNQLNELQDNSKADATYVYSQSNILEEGREDG